RSSGEDASARPRIAQAVFVSRMHQAPRCRRAVTTRRPATLGPPTLEPHAADGYLASPRFGCAGSLALNCTSPPMSTVDLSKYGISVRNVLRNAQPSVLYEQALTRNEGEIVSSGALAARSGEKTGRSPKDKRIVDAAPSNADVWWGSVNIKLEEKTFDINKRRAVDFLNTRDQLYVVDGLAGWDPKHQIKVRIICLNAYHALFMHNMLIRPTAEQLEKFGEPDYVIYNSGLFPANPHTGGMSSATSVDLSFERGEFVI